MKNNKDVDSLSHTTWRCQYHVVFAPKYRRMVIYGQIKKDIGQILRKLCEQKDIEIIEAEACPDHIHMLISFSPKYSISYVIFYTKKPAPSLLQQLPGAGFCTQTRIPVCTRVIFECPSAFLVGAGGCREPRKIKRNPGRGSQRLRRALGGTRILLAAAPTAPPCFCRWQRSSLLHWAVFAPSSATSPQLFESTLESET